MQDHTRDLARGLVRADHEVVVITSRHPDGALEEIVDGVRYVFVDAPRHQNHPAWLRESYRAFVRLHAERPFDLLHSESSCAVEHVRRGVHRELPVVVMFHGTLLGLAPALLGRVEDQATHSDPTRAQRHPVAHNPRASTPWELVPLPTMRGDRSVQAAGKEHVPLVPPQAVTRARRPEQRRRRALPASVAVRRARNLGARRRAGVRHGGTPQQGEGHPSRRSGSGARERRLDSQPRRRRGG